MAAVVLRERLSASPAGVESAGLMALVGHPIHPLAQHVLSAHGLSMASHAARQLDLAAVDAAELVLAMEKRHLTALQAMIPGARKKMFLLGKWSQGMEIPDPNGRALAAFEQAYQAIETCVDDWRPHF